MLTPFALLVAMSTPSPSPGTFPHPYYKPPLGPKQLDASKLVPVQPREEPEPIAFDELDAYAIDPADAPPRPLERAPGDPARLPDGWVQRGNSVVPQALLDGLTVEPVPVTVGPPGSDYPRRHTLYLNFVGATLTQGDDENSAEGISRLAKTGDYPVFSGGETLALAIIQAVDNDLSAYGVRVVYLDRPPKMLPYTMEMVAGQWTDTSLTGAAGGVASAVDCGALNQRRIVYTFAEGVNSASLLANTASQEAAHGWGLDHSLNCDSVMSYCGGFSDQHFSTECDPLCEEQCQGAGTIGCRYVHEMYCGDGSDQQNEDAELMFLFGAREPDMEPPICEILSPDDGTHVEVGADIEIRVAIDDNYGGMGWLITVAKDGEVIYGDVDYSGQFLDAEGNAAINLSNAPEGVYEITATAMDHADQVTMDMATVYVGDVMPPGDSTGAVDSTGAGSVDGTGEGSTGVAGSSSEGGSGDGSSTGVPEDGDDKGCACASGGSPRPGAWFGIVLGAAGLVRRRRSRRR